MRFKELQSLLEELGFVHELETHLEGLHWFIWPDGSFQQTLPVMVNTDGSVAIQLLVEVGLRRLDGDVANMVRSILEYPNV